MKKNIQIENYDAFVIGCGLTGCVIARYLAEEKNKKVLILERRNHIGGNMYDYIDDNGVRVHQYGPHVFHTYTTELMEFMEKYSQWNDFPITCQVYMKDKFTPSPFNYQTIDDYYSTEDAKHLKEEIEKEYPGRDKATIVELLESKNPVVKEYADFLFESDYSLYTAKQWGISPSEIDPSVLKRVPVLFTYKDGYFDDTYQKVPVNGYVGFFKNLLAHENIEYMLETDAMEYLHIEGTDMYWENNKVNVPVIYTGAIDELVDCKYGKLPYRSLQFVWNTEQDRHFQQAALVAYPEAEGYTRITEYNHFPNQIGKREKSSLAYEYPLMYDGNKEIEPYYPVLTTESMKLFETYKEELSKVDNLYLFGRLAEFKYYNMDQALQSALEACKNVFSKIV